MSTSTDSNTMLPAYLRVARLTGAFLGCVVCVSALSAETIVQRLTIFSSQQATPFRPHPWKMTMEEAEGGTRARGTCLWFNTDWQATPWAGVRFDAPDAPTFQVTEEWIEKGFIRFHINVTVDRHGNIGGGDQYQLMPITRPPVAKYQALRSQHVDRGRGIDEEASTWQEVLVPLKYFTDLKPGHVVRGLNFQTRGQIERVFSLDDVEYVRFDALPDWMLEQLNQEVSQPWVKWPAYEEFPEVARADRRPPSVQDGVFVGPDGNRIFVLNPYCREDSRTAYGNQTPGKLPPTHGLYDREKHGWIYDEIPTTEYLCRLGFNSFSSTPTPMAWWRSVGLEGRYGAAEDDFLSSVLTKRVTLPYYVDLVSWPYTMGKPGLNIDNTTLPASAATKGRNHWTQYRIIGAGRRAWIDMWTLNARRYRDAGANVLAVELMNEPAYMGESEDHYAEFEQWLEARYGSVAAVNRTWGTDFSTLSEASVYRYRYEKMPTAGQRLDYDEYLSERFSQMIDEGVKTVTDILPNAPVGVQPMGGYLRTPHEAVWKHRIARHETVVLTPTGGGRWTRGSGASRPAATLTAHPMADAPIENDLLLAVAGEKMIVDNETYLRGQTRQDTRNRLWEHVVCGLDGLTVFSWSKRGWVWWKDRDTVQVDADKYPYSSLIPLARRTDALRGILDFSVEVQTLAPRILPKPWGPAPKIGVLYSWDNARRRVVEPKLYDKTPVYYAAMRYGHWNMCMLPSDQVIAEGVPSGIDVVVAGGLTHVERELPAVLRAFVERGGILVLGECDFTQDVHGRPLPVESRLVDADSAEPTAVDSSIELRGATQTLFPGTIETNRLQQFSVADATTTVARDSQGRGVVCRRLLGNGAVYYQGADLFGYSLGKLLHGILTHAAGGKIPPLWRAVEITKEDGRLAPNVLVSRRSYQDYHAILLHNRDRYERTVRLAVPGLQGMWRVSNALTDEPTRVVPGSELSTDGVKVSLAPTGPAVVLLERPEEPGQSLRQ